MTLALQRKDDIADVSDVYDEDEEGRALLRIIEPRYRAMLRAMHRLLSDTVFREREEFRLTDEDVERVLLHAAEQVVRISDTTRTQIREVLIEGQRLGLSTWEIAHGNALGFRGIDGLYMETWRGRPDMIARTELQNAQLISAQDRYRASGLVDRMRIVDGDDDAPCASRNGRVVPVTESVGLRHPNCTANVIPILRGRE